jgi:hypothetical protein
VFFFAPGQGTVDRTGMDPDSKTLFDGFADRLIGGCLAPLFDKIQNLIGTLMGLFRTSSRGNQSRQPFPIKGFFRQVESLAADSERSGCLLERLTLDPVSTQHLVLDLHLIAWIEELFALKAFILNTLGMRMQSLVTT